jgi:SAM-dependent methyltransferase
MDYDKGGKEKDTYTESEVEQVSCPFCRTDKFRNLYTERGALGVVRCLGCGLIYVNPRLKNPEKVYWGEAEKYFDEAKLIFYGKAKHHRDQNYLEDLKRIKQYKPSGRFLDIGTNMGFFLRMAKGGSWDLYGVEPSPSLSELARKYFGLNVKTAYLEAAGFESNYFDVITLTDVFEHIADPGKMLNEIKRILKPDGVLFIKVPNGLFNLFKLKLAQLTGRLKNYDLFDSYEHVVHYSSSLLEKMLKKHGFKIIDQDIGSPIQLPVWHNYVGSYYQYPSPWRLDYKRQTARRLLFYLSKIEFYLSGKRVGYLAPNIIAIARKES